MRNHPSWEDDPAAQAALGPIIAKWLAQGVLEYVQWDDRQPVLLQPCGAVPNGTAPFSRLITDARYGNKMYSDWGVTYSSAADLLAALQPRDVTWSADLQDANHLSVFAGCGGALRPCKRPLVQQDGTVTWLDGYIVGCSPDTRLGGCDKDMFGLSISGHVFRFAACRFGQKTAGSPLNSLVMSVARYFARLPDPVHVATWVDDLHFSMRTPDHPPCAGHATGCPICAKAYERAVAAEALWRRKAQALHLPLSDGKGHSVAQGGPLHRRVRGHAPRHVHDAGRQTPVPHRRPGTCRSLSARQPPGPLLSTRPPLVCGRWSTPSPRRRVHESPSTSSLLLQTLNASASSRPHPRR